VEAFEILADDELYRRLADQQVDPDKGKARRNAFYRGSGPDPEISVQVKRLVPSPRQALIDANRPHFGMGMLRVLDVLALGLRVEARPLPDDPAHAVILGADTRTVCDQLAEITDVIIWPAFASAST
jgi:hypothetical protein